MGYHPRKVCRGTPTYYSYDDFQYDGVDTFTVDFAKLGLTNPNPANTRYMISYYLNYLTGFGYTEDDGSDNNMAHITYKDMISGETVGWKDGGFWTPTASRALADLNKDSLYEFVNILIEKKWNKQETEPKQDTLYVIYQEDGTRATRWDFATSSYVNIPKLRLKADDLDGKLMIGNVRYKDDQGNIIKYTVKEDALPGYQTAMVAENYKFTFTNTFDIPQTDVTATKTWVDGPAIKPTIYFQLMRHIEGGTPSAVSGAEILALENGTVEVTWSAMDAMDAQYNDYIFSVREVDAAGNDVTPANYVKTENGLQVTNTYTSPLQDITVDVIWIGGTEPRPDSHIRLYADGEEVKDTTIVNGQSEFTFTALPITKPDGSVIVYTITQDELTDYTTTIDTFTVINRAGIILPETPTEPVQTPVEPVQTPVEPAPPVIKNELPSTGAGNSTMFLIAEIGLLAAGALIVNSKKQH